MHGHLERPTGHGLRWLNVVLLLIGLTLGLLFLDSTGALAPVRSRATQLLAPLQQALGGMGQRIGNTWSGINGSAALREQHAQLEHELSTLRTENLRLQAFEAENQQLRQALDLRQRFRWRTLAASVVSSDIDPDRQSLMIDRGTEDGVQLGMVVVSQQGGSPMAMIGTVVEVGPRNARVLLITDYRSVISGRVLHTAEAGSTSAIASGEVQGRWQMGSWLMMENLEREATLAEGDVVVTAGLSQKLGADTPLARIPADVPVGTLQAVHSQGHTQSAEVRPYLDPKNVRDVWVIVGSD